MKNQKIFPKIKGNEKLYRILAIFSALLILNNIFNNSTYISRLIKTIDKATDIVLIVNDVEVNTFLFDKVIPEFVYGEIVDINKPWDYLLGKDSKKYGNANIKIHYLKDDKIIGKAQVFTSYDSNDEYIFFMKNVYYKSNKNFNSLISPYLSRNTTGTPTLPEDVPEGIEHLYEFSFSDRYDSKIDKDFSFTFSEKVESFNDTLFLFEIYENETESEKEHIYDGDGMVPHMYKTHRYNFRNGSLIIGTHYYKPDNVEYISYLWTDIRNIKTNKNIEVGSTEKELLSTYTECLYYIDKNEAISGMGSLYFAYEDSDKEALVEQYDFDYAYTWQPFTPETNEIRDITFYIKGDKVTALEIIEPYELRHVYGYDRDTGLQYVNKKRKAL
ncbi:MAG: hypothetical protein M0P77_10225 [Firmicutes bacterium]|nr:hypothetical protein [Bacillota bacterium]